MRNGETLEVCCMRYSTLYWSESALQGQWSYESQFLFSRLKSKPERADPGFSAPCRRAKMMLLLYQRHYFFFIQFEARSQRTPGHRARILTVLEQDSQRNIKNVTLSEKESRVVQKPKHAISKRRNPPIGPRRRKSTEVSGGRSCWSHSECK